MEKLDEASYQLPKTTPFVTELEAKTMRHLNRLITFLFAALALFPGVVLAQSVPALESGTSNSDAEQAKDAKPDPSAASEIDIAEITNKQVYDTVAALAPEFKKCLKIGERTRCLPGGSGPRRPSDNNYYKYYVSYDKYGTVYSVEHGFYDGAGNCGEMDKCVIDVLPDKFDIDFSEIVKTYSDDVQKYGRFEFLYNINSKKITFKHKAPIGSPAQKGERHFEYWQLREKKMSSK
ncbi:MAG: hypothetical protein IJU23_09440 [Proteobacteria bacterium]|nr:hypothetical protein [Pseudomonadota bacterium]